MSACMGGHQHDTLYTRRGKRSESCSSSELQKRRQHEKWALRRFTWSSTALPLASPP